MIRHFVFFLVVSWAVLCLVFFMRFGLVQLTILSIMALAVLVELFLN